MYPSDRMQSHQTSCPALLIANLFRSHELNAGLTENAMALPQTVGFKAETVDEEAIWCPCTVKDLSIDSVIVSTGKIGKFPYWNFIWISYGICVEIHYFPNVEKVQFLQTWLLP